MVIVNIIFSIGNILFNIIIGIALAISSIGLVLHALGDFYLKRLKAAWRA